MKRFLMLLAVAVTAAATYVAAAPGGAPHSGPTAKQFNALKREVAARRGEANSTHRFILVCMVQQPLGIDEVGDPGFGAGYEYVDPKVNGGSPSLTTALDFEQGSVYQAQYEVYKVNPAHECPSLITAMQEH